MRHRVTVLTTAVLAGATMNTLAATPAAADEPGFSVSVQAPDEFTVGEAGQTVTAVVTSQNRQCRKVRWSLLVHGGIDADQLRVSRIEDDPDFRFRTLTEGDSVRFVDEALDPGLLCRGRTVTGRWQIEFDGPDGGEIQFEAQAFDVRDRLLSTGGAAAEVDGGRQAAPEPAPSAAEEEEDEKDQAAPPAAPESDGPVPGALASQESSLLGPGLIVGGVFVFLGVILLARLRARARAARRRAQALPTGFYTMPGAPR
ncbi:hypothetical protein AB0F81_22880 [Actinoplanes sp. NPDC024001]|uniref:hypothetical protein n=1 Tax=Actinoplanes sp. NPDC024001 TaxID=3154598 RepID=UPI0033E1B82B